MTHIAVDDVLIRISSVQEGIYALEKAHMRSNPSLRSFRNGAFETVPMLKSISVGCEQ